MIYNVGTPNAMVSSDVALGADAAIQARLNELNELLRSGNITPEEGARIVVAINDLKNASNELLGYTHTVDELADAMAAIDKADLILGGEPGRVGGSQMDSRVNPGMWDTDSRTYDGPYLTQDAWHLWKGEDLISNGPALRSFFESDPQGFTAMWRDLSAEDRQLAMFTLQQEVALDNQITQMLTGLMRSSHDTAMAVARNLQV